MAPLAIIGRIGARDHRHAIPRRLLAGELHGIPPAVDLQIRAHLRPGGEAVVEAQLRPLLHAEGRVDRDDREWPAVFLVGHAQARPAACSVLSVKLQQHRRVIERLPLPSSRLEVIEDRGRVGRARRGLKLRELPRGLAHDARGALVRIPDAHAAGNRLVVERPEADAPVRQRIRVGVLQYELLLVEDTDLIAGLLHADARPAAVGREVLRVRIGEDEIGLLRDDLTVAQERGLCVVPAAEDEAVAAVRAAAVAADRGVDVAGVDVADAVDVVALDRAEPLEDEVATVDVLAPDERVLIAEAAVERPAGLAGPARVHSPLALADEPVGRARVEDVVAEVIGEHRHLVHGLRRRGKQRDLPAGQRLRISVLPEQAACLRQRDRAACDLDQHRLLSVHDHAL